MEKDLKKLKPGKRGYRPLIGNIQSFGKMAILQDGTRYLITDKGWRKIDLKGGFNAESNGEETDKEGA